MTRSMTAHGMYERKKNDGKRTKKKTIKIHWNGKLLQFHCLIYLFWFLSNYTHNSSEEVREKKTQNIKTANNFVLSPSTLWYIVWWYLKPFTEPFFFVEDTK